MTRPLLPDSEGSGSIKPLQDESYKTGAAIGLNRKKTPANALDKSLKPPSPIQGMRLCCSAKKMAM
jgi:hypothetical protein